MRIGIWIGMGIESGIGYEVAGLMCGNRGSAESPPRTPVSYLYAEPASLGDSSPIDESLSPKLGATKRNPE